MAIKLYHEAPKSIFTTVQKHTDGDYALVHLLEEDPEYLALFKQAKEDGREIILDNSIFELEEAFNAEKFAKWVVELRPDWYIIPDALEDVKKTCNQAHDWVKKYVDLPGKSIGVIQGKDYHELKTCYEYMDKYVDVDMIAISFDYSYYTHSFPHPNKYVSWMLGRVKLLGDLVRDSVINTSKPHHLLGCSLPVEGKFYGQYNWIYSMDTSNPVVHALKNIQYEKNFGLYSKESQKLFELINTPASDIDENLVIYNMRQFRDYWKIFTF